MLNSTTKDGFQNILYIFAGLIITSFTLALQPIFFLKDLPKTSKTFYEFLCQKRTKQI